MRLVLSPGSPDAVKGFHETPPRIVDPSSGADSYNKAGHIIADLRSGNLIKSEMLSGINPAEERLLPRPERLIASD